MFLKKLKLKSNTEVMVCDNLSGFIDKKRPEFMYHSDVNAINNLKKEENFMINYKLIKLNKENLEFKITNTNESFYGIKETDNVLSVVCFNDNKKSINFQKKKLINKLIRQQYKRIAEMKSIKDSLFMEEN